MHFYNAETLHVFGECPDISEFSSAEVLHVFRDGSVNFKTPNKRRVNSSDCLVEMY